MIILVFIITSCSEDNSYTLVNNAIKKTLSLPSFELEWERNVKTEADSITDISGNFIHMMAENYNLENERIFISNYSNGLDTTTFYFEDDYCYYSINPEVSQFYCKTYKENVSDYYIMRLIRSIFEDFLVEFPIEYLSDAVITKKDNGLKSVMFYVPYEFIFKNSEFTPISNPQIEITVNNDGYISEYKFVCSMISDTSYQTYITTQTEVISFINPSKSVEIESIEGYEIIDETHIK